jgi:hypothetical protein
MNLPLRKAVTLAELMIAVLFLTVVLGGIVGLFLKCMLLNESNRSLTTAASHVQYVMESIRAQDDLTSIKTAINAGTWSWDTDNEFITQEMERLPVEAISACYYAYTCSDCDSCTACSACVDVPGDPLRVLVRADWEDATGRAHQYILKTFFSF